MMEDHEDPMVDRGRSMIYHESDLTMRGHHHPVSARLLRSASTRSARSASRPDNVEETTRGALLGDSPTKTEAVVSIGQEDDASVTSDSTAEVGLAVGQPYSGIPVMRHAMGTVPRPPASSFLILLLTIPLHVLAKAHTREKGSIQYLGHVAKPLSIILVKQENGARG